MHSADRQPGYSKHTILLMEADPSLRRMIALSLRHRGLHVIEAVFPDDFTAVSQRSPDLILLDIDGEVGNGAEMLAEIRTNPKLASLPTVLLSWDAPIPGNEANLLMQHASLAKPFDARTLHTVIEAQLLQANQLPGAEESIAQGITHTATPGTYAPSATPSFCPVITAAGLLMAFIGLMLQIAVTAVGLVIVIAALLWWTLGTKPENYPVARQL